MNDWMRINRIRGPVYILTAGVLGLLAEFTRYGWSRTWPIWIIVTGLLMFAQHNARRSATLSACVSHANSRTCVQASPLP